MQFGHERHNVFFGQDGQKMQEEQKRREMLIPATREDFLQLWRALDKLVQASVLLTLEFRTLETKLLELEEEKRLLRNELDDLKRHSNLLCNDETGTKNA